MCQTVVPEQHVESSKNCLDNCDLGAFQYSKNLSTRASESTNFQFQILHRRNVIWGLFWKLILGVLGSPNRGNGWFLNFMKSYLYWCVSGDAESCPKKFRWNWTMATTSLANCVKVQFWNRIVQYLCSESILVQKVSSGRISTYPVSFKETFLFQYTCHFLSQFGPRVDQPSDTFSYDDFVSFMIYLLSHHR